MSENTVQQPGSGKIKFIVGALLGAFLFLAPIPTGDGAFNIPLGLIIDRVNDVLEFGEADTEDIRVWLAYSFIIISCLGTLIAHIFKPKFIMENERLKSVFVTNWLYTITRVVAVIIMTMVIFDFGPAEVIDRWDGGGLMVFDLITSLTTIFLILSFATPLLTEFGLMEFVGVLIKKFVNLLFRLPGRAAVDLAASWFGSSAVAVMITRDQHEKGFYTGREAAVICANFAVVSVPFSFIIASTVGVESYFAIWYLIVIITCVIIGIIAPRIWPLSQLPDTYLEGVTNQLDEEVEEGGSRFEKAVTLASARADEFRPFQFVEAGLNGWVTAFMDLFPVIVAWGTIAIIINATTPIFDWIAWPMGLILEVFRVPGGAEYASATVVGFIDMFLPALVIGSETYFNTRFILGALSIVQIIYMAETGILILKSKMPIGLGKLAILFLMRTLIGLPIIIALTYLASLIGLI